MTDIARTMDPSTLTDNPGPVAADTDLPAFYFIVTFWGKRYREWFCRYSLASLLAEGNIPALRNRAECRFLICTSRPDWLALQHEPLFRRLKDLVEPVFLESTAGQQDEHKYSRMSRGHAALTSYCHERRAAAIYLPCDTIVPDGSVAELQRLAAGGAHVVLCSAVRFDMDRVEAELVARGLRAAHQPLTLSRRDAVAIGLRNLHSETQGGEWDKPHFGALAQEHQRQDFPVCCYWDVPGENGIIIYTHNWAPFLICFGRLAKHDAESLRKWAIDGDYIYRNFGNRSIGREVHVVTDSDSLFLLGLTPGDEMATLLKPRLLKSLPILGGWFKGYILNQVVFDLQTDLLRRRIYPLGAHWHARDLSPSWEPVARRAQEIIRTYAAHDMNPRRVLQQLRGTADIYRFLTSRQALLVLWIILVFWILLPLIRYPNIALRFGGRQVLTMTRAIMGGKQEQARLARRFRIIGTHLRLRASRRNEAGDSSAGR